MSWRCSWLKAFFGWFIVLVWACSSERSNPKDESNEVAQVQRALSASDADILDFEAPLGTSSSWVPDGSDPPLELSPLSNSGDYSLKMEGSGWRTAKSPAITSLENLTGSVSFDLRISWDPGAGSASGLVIRHPSSGNWWREYTTDISSLPHSTWSTITLQLDADLIGAINNSPGSDVEIYALANTDAWVRFDNIVFETSGGVEDGGGCPPDPVLDFEDSSLWSWTEGTGSISSGAGYTGSGLYISGGGFRRVQTDGVTITDLGSEPVTLRIKPDSTLN